MKKTARIIVFLTLALLIGNQLAAAAEHPAGWFDYTQARADVAGFLAGDKLQALVEGSFSLKYPHSFSLTYYAEGSWRKIISYDDLLQLYGSRRKEYVADDFWLFNLYNDYIYGLAEITSSPLDFVDEGEWAQRKVTRYTQEGNRQNVYWIDQQTGIPLLGRHGEKTVISVSNYTFESDCKEHYNVIELDLNFAPDPGKLTLLYTGGHWVPKKLEVQQEEGLRTVEFSNWQVGEEEIGEISILKELSTLIKKIDQEMGEENWQAAIGTLQKALAVDAYYWQGYFYLGYAYGRLDNYLGAVESYQQALMLVPDHAAILNNLAYTYFLQEVHLQRGIEKAERAVQIERKPTNLDTLGYGYYLLGRFEEAEQFLREALEMAEKNERKEIEEHLALVLKALPENEE